MEDCIHETIIGSLGFSLSGQRYSKLHNTLSGKTKPYKIFSADETTWIQESRSSRQLEKITCWGPYKLFILERSFQKVQKMNAKEVRSTSLFPVCFSARSMKCNIDRLRQKFSELGLSLFFFN